MRILWDEPRRRTTLARRGVDFASLDPAFFEAATLTPARHGRFRAVGWSENAIVAVTFARLGTEAISVISMRRASRKERKAHEAKGSASHR
jgi:uncharacterized DUF497 family protein